jgi:hypothetical protein
MTAVIPYRKRQRQVYGHGAVVALQCGHSRLYKPASGAPHAGDAVYCTSCKAYTTALGRQAA